MRRNFKLSIGIFSPTSFLRLAEHFSLIGLVTFLFFFQSCSQKKENVEIVISEYGHMTMIDSIWEDHIIETFLNHEYEIINKYYIDSDTELVSYEFIMEGSVKFEMSELNNCSNIMKGDNVQLLDLKDSIETIEIVFAIARPGVLKENFSINTFSIDSLGVKDTIHYRYVPSSDIVAIKLEKNGQKEILVESFICDVKSGEESVLLKN